MGAGARTGGSLPAGKWAKIRRREADGTVQILVVDDEPMVRSSIARMINSLGESYEAHEADDGEDALLLVNSKHFDLIITDIRMPEIDGLQLTEMLQQQHPNIRVVLLTGYAEFEYALCALRNGVHEYLLKPASKESIIAVIRKLEEELRLEREQQEVGRTRENSVLEKRIQDLLYELPVPHVDQELFPPYQSIFVLTMTADAETLKKQTIRFAMKNVLEDVLGCAGKMAVIVEERLVTAVLFATEIDLDINKFDLLSVEAKQTLERLFRIEVKMSCAGGSESAADISLLYMECLRKLGANDWASVGSAPENNGIQHRLVRTALEWMDNEYSVDLTLASIAERLFVNPNYLSTLFKSETGMTFTQYLTRIRVERAKQLLKETNLKIYEICDKVGYTDQAYFSKLFKATVGITPYEYRNPEN